MKEGKILDRIFDQTNLYAESAPGTTVVELTANRRVLIENHRGVTTYGCSEICVNGSNGTICIRGKYLQLARMSKLQLVITGCVECITIL